MVTPETQAVIQKTTTWLMEKHGPAYALLPDEVAGALMLAPEHKRLACTCDDAALSGDEAATKNAARAWIAYWREHLKAATEKASVAEKHVVE